MSHSMLLLKPRPGQTVKIATRPGIWQIAVQHPDVRTWWLLPWDAVARTSGGPLTQGHHYAHVLDIEDPTPHGGSALTTLTISRNGTEKVRRFNTRDEAIKYGVAYYLTDNGYASRGQAKRVADKVHADGHATHDGIGFLLGGDS